MIENEFRDILAFFFLDVFVECDVLNKLLNCDFENTILDLVVCFWFKLAYDFKRIDLSHRSVNLWNIVREKIDYDVVFSHQTFENSFSHLLISFCNRIFLIHPHLSSDRVFFLKSENQLRILCRLNSKSLYIFRSNVKTFSRNHIIEKRNFLFAVFCLLFTRYVLQSCHWIIHIWFWWTFSISREIREIKNA